MTNSSTSSPQRSAAAVSLRKTNKPLMEKRRRARINESLTQLKSLVIQSSKKDSSQFNKLEKADILELTVKHLRNLQSRDQQHQINPEADSTGKYCSGFMECANEVVRFLQKSQDFSEDVKNRVVGHLASCLQLTQSYPSKGSAQQQLPAPAPAPVITNAALLATNQQNASSATTAQLTNGQIIQIVNATPFQQHQTAAATLGQYPPSTAPSAPAMQITNSHPVAVKEVVVPTSQQHLSQHQQQPHQSPVPLLSVVSQNVPTATTLSNTSLLREKAYMRFAQPLHIQIPQSNVSQTVHKPESRQQTEIVRPAEVVEKQLPVKHYRPSLSPVDTVHSSTSSPSPLPSRFDHSLPKYINIHPTESHQRDNYLPRSRTYSMTSSSSESELSPLNLSQSPSSSSTASSSYDVHKEANIQGRFSSEQFSARYKVEGDVSPSSFSRYHPRDYKENLDMAQHPNFTSVIVNANRRPVDMGVPAKYMGMDIEHDRLCFRPHGTPSPASSMGEERLWRPW